jgi:hypothetical protein
MGKSNLAEQYPDSMDTLLKLLDPENISDQLKRLEEIHEVVELAWERNIARIKDKPIRYLLVAEAAPWTPNGNHPRYFYESLNGAWVGRVLRAFFGQHRFDTDEESWSELANRGFLLVDTLPFALKYITRVRRGSNYLNLLKASKEYFIEKLNHPKITWDENVKAAFAFRWNGLRVMEAYGSEARLPNGHEMSFDESLIAADGSGYTSTSRLCDIWGLPMQHHTTKRCRAKKSSI